MPTSRKILVSGFEAFGGASINPTEMLVEALRAGEIELPAGFTLSSADESATGYLISTVLLPVEFKNAFLKLRNTIVHVKPDIVLALGQAGGRDAIELERVAVNLMDSEIPDNSGFHPREEAIAADGENALFSTLPLQQLVSDLRAESVPARISNTAGLYVCNDLFYRLQSLGLTSGFVHVPFLPEQTRDKPSLPFETMKRALATMLATLTRS